MPDDKNIKNQQPIPKPPEEKPSNKTKDFSLPIEIGESTTVKNTRNIPKPPDPDEPSESLLTIEKVGKDTMNKKEK